MIGVGAALLLSACSSTLIPPSAGPSAPAPSQNGQKSPPAPVAPPPVLRPEPGTPPAVVPGDNALGAGFVQGPPLADFLRYDARTRAALAAFRISCPSLVRRADSSGLTRGQDWANACAVATSWPDDNAAEFFVRYFEAVQIGDGKAFATGYYEPEISGSRTQQGRYQVPVYRRPNDLIDVDLGLFTDSLKGRTVRGQVNGQKLVPYADRAAIENGALAGRGLEIAWAADVVEFFFLQIQGSGRLRLPDGSVMRIGYDGQNGRDYTGIGKLMKDRGLIQAGSMQDIMGYLRANPVEGRAIMNENKSFIFFKELTGPGPLGALGLPVTAEASVAADPRYIPLGAPIFLSLDRAEASGLWIAQDTGGAIKGANRVDTFWGAGDRARQIAGGMSGRGSAYLLLPIGSYARLTADYGRTTTP
ncbi:MAG: hypothetical protein E2598_05125 [Sphingobium sp.]|nr:hypothetical protein [Sphingobium sp.]